MALATKRTKKTELNRQTLDAITRGVADGLFAMARGIVEGAEVPDLPPLTVGLIETGGALVYVDGKVVDATGIGGKAVRKPRAVKIRDLRGEVVAIGGYGFPARLVELGSIHNTPHPFLTPQLMATVSDAEGFIRAATAKRLAAGHR
jgi:hypothetical protein